MAESVTFKNYTWTWLPSSPTDIPVSYEKLPESRKGSI